MRFSPFFIGVIFSAVGLHYFFSPLRGLLTCSQKTKRPLRETFPGKNFFSAGWSPDLQPKNETSSSGDVSGKEISDWKKPLSNLIKLTVLFFNLDKVSSKKPRKLVAEEVFPPRSHMFATSFTSAINAINRWCDGRPFLVWGIAFFAPTWVP